MKPGGNVDVVEVESSGSEGSVLEMAPAGASPQRQRQIEAEIGEEAGAGSRLGERTQ